LRAPTYEGSLERSRGIRNFLLDGVYLGGLCFVVPYLALTGKARRVLEHIPRRSRDVPRRAAGKPCLWLHGVSVGEILSARSLLRLFQAEFPDWDVVLSTTTRAGLEVARIHYPGLSIVSYPFDMSFLVQRAFDRIQPDIVVIVEHELWPNFLWHAQACGVPVVMVNGRMSERSFRGYRWMSRFLRWPPPAVVTFCVEDAASAECYRKLGVPADRIHVTGNLKFDNAPSPASGMRESLGLNGSEWVLVGASTHAGEEDILLDSFGSLYGEDAQARLIIAPRNVARVDELSGLVQKKGFQALRWSEVRGASGPYNAAAPWHQNGHGEVLIVDTLGELDRIASAADVVFVGGSLVPFGGHNVIAPAGLGRPVVIGPHFSNFRSVVSTFIERKALLVAQDAGDFTSKLQELRRDPGMATRMGTRARDTVSSHVGASGRTLDVLKGLLERIDGRSKAGFLTHR